MKCRGMNALKNIYNNSPKSEMQEKGKKLMKGNNVNTAFQETANSEMF